MKKLTLIGLVFLVSISSFAATKQARYACESIWGQDVGTIILFGDPVKNIYTEVANDGNAMSFRSGVTDRAYLYLFDDARFTQPSYALEVVNYQDSYENFEMSVFGKDQIVIGSRKISMYSCSQI